MNWILFVRVIFSPTLRCRRQRGRKKVIAWTHFRSYKAWARTSRTARARRGAGWISLYDHVMSALTGKVHGTLIRKGFWGIIRKIDAPAFFLPLLLFNRPSFCLAGFVSRKLAGIKVEKKTICNVATKWMDDRSIHRRIPENCISKN